MGMQIANWLQVTGCSFIQKIQIIDQTTFCHFWACLLKGVVGVFKLSYGLQSVIEDNSPSLYVFIGLWCVKRWPLGREEERWREMF